MNCTYVWNFFYEHALASLVSILWKTISVQGGGKWADSGGISGTGETPEEQRDEEAHRPPRGKRPISRSPLSQQTCFFNKLKKLHLHKEGAALITDQAVKSPTYPILCDFSSDSPCEDALIFDSTSRVESLISASKYGS